MILQVLAVTEKVLEMDVKYASGPTHPVTLNAHLITLRDYRRKMIAGEQVSVSPELRSALLISIEQLKKELYVDEVRHVGIINTCIDQLQKLLGKV